ncbi:Ig-like domain-containing protein [Nonomuraea sp. C10]|uniref:Ig-like domain-containing protein n=1 Tax=Nonomuraea sp. C10 TaxID=2600577 RepID=UPI0011CD80C5|nr:Ig-like domain-containing protein [Nonomuraea sp. C10]TXK38583.1 hypothetical protein FR742_02500 [Nonomuraea sp. C10]
MSEVMRFYYEGEPEPQMSEEWEAFMNDPDRFRGYPALPDPEDITAEELLEQLQAVDTRSVRDSNDPLLSVPPEQIDPPVEDTDPPTAVASGPEKDAAGVHPKAEIWAVFSESVTEARMELKGPDGSPVAGNSQQENEDIAAFLPEQPLAVDTRYTVEVSGAKDAAGNVMSGPHTWSFTTGADVPTVSGFEPGRDATDAPPDIKVMMTINEAVTDVQVIIKDPSDTAAQGALSSDNGNTLWTFTPAAPLAVSTVYRVEVSGAKNDSGNVMAPYTWSFTTGETSPTEHKAAG